MTFKRLEMLPGRTDFDCWLKEGIEEFTVTVDVVASLPISKIVRSPNQARLPVLPPVTTSLSILDIVK